jgi:hypothetical protein
MSVKICIFHLCALLVLTITSCDSKSTSNQPSPESQKSTATSASPSDRPNEQKSVADTTTESAKTAFDACALIAPAEIAVVMGHPVKETKTSKPTSSETSSFERWQCFYTVEPFDRSVSLEVTRNNPNVRHNALAQFWKKTFQEAKDTRKSVKPKAVPAIGDEAFWVGDNKAGALYVLKNDSYLRISIGGPDDESVKIEKLKTLAQNALKRL